MKPLYTLFIASASCLLISNASAQSNLRRQLVGQWQNVYLKVRLNIYDAKVAVMEADSSNWEARLGIKPIRTFFNSDNTYSSEYRNLKDSIVRVAAGTWELQ